MGHKRKRQTESDSSNAQEGEPVSKVQLIEDGTSQKPTPQNKADKQNAKSLRKQLRSERKSKKAEKAKENAKKKLLLGAQAGASSSSLQADDGIAGGQDFVPLGSEENVEVLHRENKKTKSKTKEYNSKPYSKGKGSSPRSIRKAAKAAKALSLMTEEYGADTVHDADSKGVANGADKNKTKSAPRFICFVGNLPYSCTTEQIQAHFRKLDPKSIRHPVDKESGKSKGYAFLEFHDYDKMKTCLKLYHHSIFEPDRTARLQAEAGVHASDLLPRIADKKNKGRMLNVELTAGGGGRSGDRKKKIHEKNVKLEKQRAKARVKAMKQAKEEAKKARKEKDAAGVSSGANGVPVDTDVRGDIHPSRLNRVKA